MAEMTIDNKIVGSFNLNDLVCTYNPSDYITRTVGSLTTTVGLLTTTEIDYKNKDAVKTKLTYTIEEIKKLIDAIGENGWQNEQDFISALDDLNEQSVRY